MLKPFDTTIDLTQLSAEYFEERGIKAILLDLDDTLIPEHQGMFPDLLIPWLKMLIAKGFKVGIVSNNMQRSYCHKVLGHLKRAKIDIPMMGDALKPVPVSFKRMLSILGVQPSEAVLIGDGIMTDLLGGKLAGIRTIRAKCFPRAFYYTGPLFIMRELAVCIYDVFRRVVLSHRPKLYLLPDSQYRHRQRICVVLNPKSSQTNELQLQELLLEQADTLGIQIDFLVTDNPPKSLKQKKHLLHSSYYDCIVAAGGDGTVRAVIEAVYREDPSIPIAILPTGTGNLMAKGLGIPQDIEEAAHLIFHGLPSPQSVTVVNDKYVALLAVGIGLDAEIMHETTSDLKKKTGILAYVISAVKVGVFKNKALFWLRLDNKKTVSHRGEGVILIHRNHYLKAFLPLDVAVEKNENTLDVCVIQARSTADALLVIQSLFSGEYDQQNGVIKHYQASEVSVRPLPAEKVQLDGDVVPMSHIHAKLVPDGISIITPQPVAPVEEVELEPEDMKVL